MSSEACQASSSWSSRSPLGTEPVLFTTAWMRPWRSIVPSTRRFRSPGSVTDPVSPNPPSSSASLAAAPDGDMRARAWPCAASSRAMAAPMPRPAAVTMATWRSGMDGSSGSESVSKALLARLRPGPAKNKRDYGPDLLGAARPEGCPRSQGSGIREPNTGWRKNRRFVEDFTGKRPRFSGDQNGILISGGLRNPLIHRPVANTVPVRSWTDFVGMRNPPLLPKTQRV